MSRERHPLTPRSRSSPCHAPVLARPSVLLPTPVRRFFYVFPLTCVAAYLLRHTSALPISCRCRQSIFHAQTRARLDVSVLSSVAVHNVRNPSMCSKRRTAPRRHPAVNHLLPMSSGEPPSTCTGRTSRPVPHLRTHSRFGPLRFPSGICRGCRSSCVALPGHRSRIKTLLPLSQIVRPNALSCTLHAPGSTKTRLSASCWQLDAEAPRHRPSALLPVRPEVGPASGLHLQEPRRILPTVQPVLGSLNNSEEFFNQPRSALPIT